MTYEKLTELINRYDIPKDVRLMSDSGWEYKSVYAINCKWLSKKLKT